MASRSPSSTTSTPSIPGGEGAQHQRATAQTRGGGSSKATCEIWRDARERCPTPTTRSFTSAPRAGVRPSLEDPRLSGRQRSPARRICSSSRASGASAVRVCLVQQRLRCQPARAVERGGPCPPADQPLRQHEGQPANFSATSTVILRHPIHRPAILHGLRSEAAARSRHPQVRASHPCGRPLPVFGDGTTRRDYTYIADVGSGVRAAIDYTARRTRSSTSATIRR